MSLKEVKAIAKEVRKVFERIEGDEGGYYGNPGPGSLGGYCGRASIQLYLACKRAGLNGIELWDGDGHTFNAYNGKIVDITATQFGQPRKVYTCKFADREEKSLEYEYGKATRCYSASKNWASERGGKREVDSDSRKVKKHLGF